MTLPSLTPQQFVQCGFLCNVLLNGLVDVVTWSEQQDRRHNDPYVFECFARGLRALIYLLAVDLTGNTEAPVQPAGKATTKSAKKALPRKFNAVSSPDTLKTGKKFIEKAPFSDWSIFRKSQNRMRTTRNNLVYHAADNTQQGPTPAPVVSGTRYVDSEGKLWSYIYPDMEHLVGWQRLLPDLAWSVYAVLQHVSNLT